MAVDPINPSDHVQAARRLASGRSTSLADQADVSRYGASGAQDPAQAAQLRADKVTLNRHLVAGGALDGEAAGSRSAPGSQGYQADLLRRRLEDAPSVGEMSVQTFEKQVTQMVRSDHAIDARAASEGRLGAMVAAESRPDVALSAAAVNPAAQTPVDSVGDARAVMAVDASAGTSGLPNSKTHAARASARYKRVAKMEDERMSILPNGRGGGSSSDLDDIDGGGTRSGPVFG